MSVIDRLNVAEYEDMMEDVELAIREAEYEAWTSMGMIGRLARCFSWVFLGPPRIAPQWKAICAKDYVAFHIDRKLMTL